MKNERSNIIYGNSRGKVEGRKIVVVSGMMSLSNRTYRNDSNRVWATSFWPEKFATRFEWRATQSKQKEVEEKKKQQETRSRRKEKVEEEEEKVGEYKWREKGWWWYEKTKIWRGM